MSGEAVSRYNFGGGGAAERRPTRIDGCSIGKGGVDAVLPPMMESSTISARRRRGVLFQLYGYLSCRVLIKCGSDTRRTAFQGLGSVRLGGIMDGGGGWRWLSWYRTKLHGMAVGVGELAMGSAVGSI